MPLIFFLFISGLTGYLIRHFQFYPYTSIITYPICQEEEFSMDYDFLDDHDMSLIIFDETETKRLNLSQIESPANFSLSFKCRSPDYIFKNISFLVTSNNVSKIGDLRIYTIDNSNRCCGLPPGQFLNHERINHTTFRHHESFDYGYFEPIEFIQYKVFKCWFNSELNTTIESIQMYANETLLKTIKSD